MGGSNSSVSPSTQATLHREIDTTVINEMLYESVTNNESVTENTMENIQNLELNVKRNIGCNIETDQTINPGFMASTEQITDSFQSVTDGIMSNLRDQANSVIQKQLELGNISEANISDIKQEVNTKIENEVKAVMETNNLTKTINDAVNVQGQVINIGETICTGGEQLSFRQNITADLAAQAISKKIMKKLAGEAEEMVMEDIFGEEEGEAEETTEGGKGAMFYGAIIGGVLLVILIIVIFAMRNKKKVNMNMYKNY